jgi:hypothetical protein
VFHRSEQIRQRGALALAALLGSALLLAACGGAEDGGDEEKIRAVIEASAMSTYPADCTRYGTLNLLEQSTKMRGREAVLACEENALEESSTPDAVWPRDIEVDGERATARVAIEGGPSGGQTIDMALVEVDGQWKLHELLSFAVFDREQMILETGRQGLEQARSEEDVDCATCVIDELEKLSDADLEALVLDPSREPLLALVQPCVPRSATA